MHQGSKCLEVVSKPQIRFKGPPKADYISNLKKIMVCIKASGRSGKRSPPEADEHLPEASAAP